MTAVIGSGGIIGIAFALLRRYIENRLTASDEREVKKRANRIRHNQIEDELQHTNGRLLFWIYRAIETGTHNGELRSAFNDYEAAEKKKKDFDREMLSEQELE